MSAIIEHERGTPMAALWLTLPSSIVGQYDPRLYLNLLVAIGALLVVVLVGYVALRLARRWTRGETAADSHANSDFASFRQLYERGELTEEEYNRIRERLSRKLRTEMHVAPPPSAPPPPRVPPLAEEPLTDIQILDPMTDIQPPPSGPERPPGEPPAPGKLEA